MKRSIGKTGVEVAAIGLGAMPLSISGRPAEAQAHEVIQATLDSHLNFIDTADVYCIDDDDIGHNERLIAKSLKTLGKTQDVYVATKGGLERPNGNWVTNGNPAHLRKACERSLKNLGVESIFLYQLHAPDDDVPWEDSVGELARLKEEGKVLHLGISNVGVDELERAQKIVRVETVQNRCNIFQKQAFSTGLVDACQKQGVTFIPHSPVGGFGGHRQMMAIASINELAKKYKTTPYCLAIAWLLAKGEHILPIPGASKPSSIRSSASVLDLEIDTGDIRLLDDLA